MSPAPPPFAPAGFTTRRQLVDGVRTGWVERSPDRTERPLVLVPGLSMSWQAYRWFLDVWPDDRPVFVVDPPGCGRSSRLPGRMTADEQATHLTNWLQHRTSGPVDLVGHSYGAVIAARMCAQRPDLVGSIIMISPSPDDRWPKMRNHVAALVRGLPAERGRVVAQATYDYLRSSPAVLAGFRREAGRSAADVMDGVDAPVLVVRGSDDQVSSAAWCARLARSATLVEVPDGAHGLPQQMPTELAHIVTAFTTKSTRPFTTPDQEPPPR